MNAFIEGIIQQLINLKNWIVELAKDRIEAFVSGDDFFSFLSIGENPVGTIAMVLASAFVLTALFFFWYLFALIRSDPEEPKGALLKRLFFSSIVGTAILILGPRFLTAIAPYLTAF
ncbi:MAG: hypothetical protein ACFFBD_19590 [Candidatus Hodarchaeota archaeon]